MAIRATGTVAPTQYAKFVVFTGGIVFDVRP